jgi:FtsP/CotA-like multicopper oxidase with cupredoxin domain
MHPRAFLASLGAAAALALAERPPLEPERIVPNDNRRSAGRLADGVLRLDLEARMGRWHPDGADDPAVVAYAFGEPGRAAEVPGPLVRVPAGTEVRLRLRNALADVPVTVHGLGASAAPGDSGAGALRLAPGAVREVRFRLDSAGTYVYWGAIADRRPRPNPGGRPPGRPIERDADETLAGAIVVDPPGARGPPGDRVLVLSIWEEPGDPADTTLLLRDALAVNGRSWPHTERLDAAAGDTVRWRVVNTSFRPHPMHLHGAYFRVDRRGDGRRDSAVAGGRGELVVTSLMPPLSTMAMSWVPERPGNWLFHCHLPRHIEPHLPLGGAPLRTADAHAAPAGGSHRTNHALEGMGGLVVGVRVRPGPRPPVVAVAARAERAIRIVARVDSGGTGASPLYRYAPDDSVRGASPPIVLTRGEPARIRVVNRLPEPTAVHWHGIELESYFDGVAGFSGDGARLAPVVAPGDSFDARFTPPRAGTFIYHTHINERRQMRAGLVGALIVLEPGRAFDAEHDRVLVFATRSSGPPEIGIAVNGAERPAPLELRAGGRYRLRLVNITINRARLRLELRTRDSGLATWRPLAKDGADLPPDLAAPSPARAPLSIGETLDVELAPSEAGEMRLEAVMPTGETVGVVPVIVR